MHSITTTLAFVMVQQGIFALGWFAAGIGLNLARRASMYWSVATLATALGLGLIAARGQVPDWLGYPLADWLTVLGMALIQRGVQIFTRAHSPPWELLGLLLGTGLVMAWIAAADGHLATGLVLATSGAVAWTLLRTAQTLFFSLRQEFGIGRAAGMSLPFALMGVAFCTRFIGGMLRPDIVGQPVNVAGAFNEALVLGFLMMGLVTNLSLSYLVVSRILSQLQRLSLHDSLTGLLNRRALQQRLELESRRMLRTQAGFAVIMLDIDYFKQLNDSFGHAAGDFALAGLAEELRAVSREIDHAARMGGEEFCLVLPQCDLDGALLVAERLRARIAAMSLPWEGEQLTLTVSLGVAATSPDEARPGVDAAEAVLRQADRALYRAKAAGRNRVEVQQPQADIRPKRATA
nr:GGDEF domain-containing protein [uncultured Roseateles sp.]